MRNEKDVDYDGCLKPVVRDFCRPLLGVRVITQTLLSAYGTMSSCIITQS